MSDEIKLSVADALIPEQGSHIAGAGCSLRMGRATGFGILAVVYMATHGNGQPLQARDIATATRAPIEYLRKVLQRLVRAGVVTSDRGRAGGFTLRRSPSEITLLELVEAIDGSITPDTVLSDDVLPLDGPPWGEPLRTWRDHTSAELRRRLHEISVESLLPGR